MAITYKTIKKPSKGVFKDKRSEFYAFAYPVSEENEIDLLRKSLKKQYYDAKHHVYAYKLQNKSIYKMSDDGEPHNSSAPAVMSQIKSYGLTDILIVVVRYFGGKKLGIPGLINAYKTAAKNAVENAEIIEKTQKTTIKINVEFDKFGGIMNIIKKEKITVENMKSSENGYTVSLSVDTEEADSIIKIFKDANCGVKTE